MHRSAEPLAIDPYAFRRKEAEDISFQEFSVQLEAAMLRFAAAEAAADHARWRAQGAIGAVLVLGALALLFVALGALWWV